MQTIFEPKKRIEQVIGGGLWTSQRAEKNKAFLAAVIIKIPASLPIEDPHQLPEKTMKPNLGSVYQITDCRNLSLSVHTLTSSTLNMWAICSPLMPVSLPTFLIIRITIKNLRTLKKYQNVLLMVCKIKVILEMCASCYRYSDTSNTLTVPVWSLLCKIFVTVHVHTSVLKCMF